MLYRYQTDILVVGGGGAGLMAAYESTKYNSKVSLVNKGKILKTGATIMAPGAISAVDNRWKVKGDSKELLIKDTIRGGNYLNDQELVKLLAYKSPDLVLELEYIGAIFQRDRSGEKYMLRIGGGHSYPRCLYLEDRTGREMTRAMMGELRKRNVTLHENIMITRIIVKDNKVVGASGLCLETLEPVLFECKSVILATGGAGSVYENTDNSNDLTGDGYALALNAGVSLRDMEFVQFYPLGFLFPPSLKGILAGMLYYSHLYNSKSERFMKKYDSKRLELSTRDVVSRAIIQEIRKGNGTPLGGVYLDMTYNEPGFIKKMTPGLYETYMNIGINPEKDMLEVAPTVHFLMGGLDINKKWETTLPGLFGAGEVCGGMHGGNRLSQNALAEIIVSGSVAGKSAAEYAKDNKITYLKPSETKREEELINNLLSNKVGEKPCEIRNKLKKTMTEDAGVYRTHKSLYKALKYIKLLQEEPIRISSDTKYMNREILEAIENKNILITSKSIILAAIERKESRGAHFREDYPNTDNKKYLFNILVNKNGEKLSLNRRKVNLKILKPET